MLVHIVFCLSLFKYYYWECCQLLTELLFGFKSVQLHLELCSSFILCSFLFDFSSLSYKGTSSAGVNWLRFTDFQLHHNRILSVMFRKFPEILGPKRETEVYIAFLTSTSLKPFSSFLVKFYLTYNCVFVLQLIKKKKKKGGKSCLQCSQLNPSFLISICSSHLLHLFKNPCLL